MGFDMEKFVVGITDDKKCGLCFCVLDNPVRTPCDHVFCSGCILPWVVRHGKCPQSCQILTPNDLDNVLPLRKTILDLRVKCDFVDRGCDETVRLMDLVSHTQDCGYRPVGCGNTGCVITLSYRDMKTHEATECLFRPVGICHKGCGQVLLENMRDSHDCLEALKSHINQQEVKIGSLNEDIKRISSKFEKREKGLVGQVTTLHTEIQIQALRFDQKLTECKHHLDRLTTENYAQCCDVQREEKTVIMLERDKTGSLGFNIMGGFTVPQENNNTKVADGIIVSRVTEGLPADNNGLKLYDRIIKMVELVDKQQIYLHKEQLVRAMTKVQKSGTTAARYLLMVFFTKQELSNGTTNEQNKNSFLLDKQIVKCIVDFCILHSENRQGMIIKAIVSKLTYNRCKANKKNKAAHVIQ